MLELNLRRLCSRPFRGLIGSLIPWQIRVNQEGQNGVFDGSLVEHPTATWKRLRVPKFILYKKSPKHDYPAKSISVVFNIPDGVLFGF